MACQAHLGEVRSHLDEIRQTGGELFVVTFSQPDVLAGYVAKNAFPFPVVTDPDRTAYREFGLERTSWARMLQPSVVGRFVKLILKGWGPRRPHAGEDIFQLGGDFVLDSQRRLTYARRSAEPTDRPSATEVVQALRAAASKAG